MLPTYMHKRKAPKTQLKPPTGRTEQVRLVECPEVLRPFWMRTGTVEGYVGDEVLVRFGEIVIQVPAEWVEGVE